MSITERMECLNCVNAKENKAYIVMENKREINLRVKLSHTLHCFILDHSDG